MSFIICLLLASGSWWGFFRFAQDEYSDLFPLLWATCPHCGHVNNVNNELQRCLHYRGVSEQSPGYARFQKEGESMDRDASGYTYLEQQDKIGLQWKKGRGAAGMMGDIDQTGIGDPENEPQSEGADKMLDMEQEGRSSGALALIGDKSLAHHVEAIKNRNTLIQRQLVALAKELFTISMYTNQKNVIVDNCKIAIGMEPGDNKLKINLFLKQTGKGDNDKLTWKDLIAELRNEKQLQPVIATLRDASEPARRRIFRKTISADKAIASYTVTTNWSVMWQDFGLELTRLLPIARMLAQEQLKQLYEDTVSEMDFIKSLDPIEDIPDEILQ